MRSNRAGRTMPEVALRSKVHRAGLRFRVNVRPVPSLRRQADLLFRSARVVVFVDGCFWHQCPEHGTVPSSNVDYWIPKLRRNVERDKETNALLELHGWTVLRIWEHVATDEAAARVISTVTARLVSSR